jgi:hypothetical protein
VIPTGNAKHNVCVGYLFWVYNGAFTLESICSIAPGFGYCALIDLVYAGQNYIKLVIKISIPEPAVVVFTEVNFF